MRNFPTPKFFGMLCDTNFRIFREILGNSVKQTEYGEVNKTYGIVRLRNSVHNLRYMKGSEMRTRSTWRHLSPSSMVQQLKTTAAHNSLNYGLFFKRPAINQSNLTSHIQYMCGISPMEIRFLLDKESKNTFFSLVLSGIKIHPPAHLKGLCHQFRISLK
jgi:hypothetical protein